MSRYIWTLSQTRTMLIYAKQIKLLRNNFCFILIWFHEAVWPLVALWLSAPLNLKEDSYPGSIKTTNKNSSKNCQLQMNMNVLFVLSLSIYAVCRCTYITKLSCLKWSLEKCDLFSPQTLTRQYWYTFLCFVRW